MQFSQFDNEIRRKQEGAGGEKLAKLDEGRTEFLEDPPQPFGRRQQGDLLLRLAHFAKRQAQRAGQRKAFG